MPEAFLATLDSADTISIRCRTGTRLSCLCVAIRGLEVVDSWYLWIHYDLGVVVVIAGNHRSDATKPTLLGYGLRNRATLNLDATSQYCSHHRKTWTVWVAGLNSNN